jgi:hypothetical protein
MKVKMLSFQFKNEVDPIAIFALIVSLSSLAWNIVQWRLNGVRFRIVAVGDLLTFPDDGLGRKISIRVSNTGGRKLQISNFSFLSNKKGRGLRYMPTNPMPDSPPIAVEVGEEKTTYFYQDRLVEEVGSKKLWCDVRFSHREKSFAVPVRFSSKN